MSTRDPWTVPFNGVFDCYICPDCGKGRSSSQLHFCRGAKLSEEEQQWLKEAIQKMDKATIVKRLKDQQEHMRRQVRHAEKEYLEAEIKYRVLDEHLTREELHLHQIIEELEEEEEKDTDE